MPKVVINIMAIKEAIMLVDMDHHIKVGITRTRALAITTHIIHREMRITCAP